MDKLVVIIICYAVIFTMLVLQFIKTNKEMKALHDKTEELKRNFEIRKLIAEVSSNTNDIIALLACDNKALVKLLNIKGIITDEDLIILLIYSFSATKE